MTNNEHGLTNSIPIADITTNQSRQFHTPTGSSLGSTPQNAAQQMLQLHQQGA